MKMSWDAVLLALVLFFFPAVLAAGYIPPYSELSWWMCALFSYVYMTIFVFGTLMLVLNGVADYRIESPHVIVVAIIALIFPVSLPSIVMYGDKVVDYLRRKSG